MSLKYADPELHWALSQEYKRQNNNIELIASENIVSSGILELQGSIFTNKYAEGYPGKRYYGGCAYVDVAEQLAIDRAKDLFKCCFANVQPHSGSQANQAVFLSLLEPFDTILGMDLSAGGHLTHGSRVNLSGKWFNAVSYGVDKKTHLIDYDHIEKLAKDHSPKLIIAGFSAYPRSVDFKRFREIADNVGAYLLVDMAHIAGLVATGIYESPFPHAHIVTSTTHKTLRGPRGGIVLTNDEGIAKKIDSALFPGLQGGPLMHVIAAKALCFKEAMEPSFVSYMKCVVENAKAMASILTHRGFDVITGGTDSHLLVVNTFSQGITGKEAALDLGRAHITCNKNTIPFDTLSPFVTSGIRIGSPACTTRGFLKDDFEQIAAWIADILTASPESKDQRIEEVTHGVLKLCARYPIYEGMFL